MIIAVDAGNTSVKLARVGNAGVGPLTRLSSRPIPDAGSISAAILALTDRSMARPDVCLVSVVPALTTLLREATAALGLRLLVAGPETIPMRIALEHPDRVGADRLLAAWGAGQRHGAPAIVVDMGTATTVDALDATGAFLGGAIAPGPDLALAALAEGTARLPLVPPEPPSRAIGRDTSEAIRSGVLLGHLGAVRELAARITAELLPSGGRPRVVVTGGASGTAWMRQALLRPAGPTLPPIADVIDDDLLLASLGMLADHHRVPSP